MRDSEMPATGEGTVAFEFARLLAERHSCRNFLPDPVPRAVIDRMLSLAQRAPSWCNTQPWQVIVTEGQATDRFRDAHYAHAAERQDDTNFQDSDFAFPERYEGIYRARQKECGWALYDSLGIALGDRTASKRQVLENFRLFGVATVAQAGPRSPKW